MKDIDYYKERACCDPVNGWGHTDNCQSKKLLDLLDILESVWLYFHPTEHIRIDRVDMLDEVYYVLINEGIITFNHNLNNEKKGER